MDGDRSLALLRRARGGDAAALTDLQRHYLPTLRRWVDSRLPARVRDVTDVDTLVQDALDRAMRSLPALGPVTRTVWHGALRAAILHRIREECERAELSHDASLDGITSDAGLAPIEIAIGHEALERYERALARLSELDREAVIARIEFGLDYADVADHLGTAGSETARAAVNHALVRLAAFMA